MPDRHEDDTTARGVDVDAMTSYMQRKGLSRMQVTVEDISESRLRRATAVEIKETRSLVEDADPSDLGLQGCFILVSEA